MSKKLKKTGFTIVLAIGLILLTSCTATSIKHDLVQQASQEIVSTITNTDIATNPQRCSAVKNKCTNGNYQEWITPQGEKACVCS